MGEKLSRKQEQAISALLTPPTLGQAAQASGVAESTLRRWLKHEAFQTAYRQACRDAVGQVIARLQQVTMTAVNTLDTIQQDPAAKESARVAAAKTTLYPTPLSAGGAGVSTWSTIHAMDVHHWRSPGSCGH
jgi:hypothetical protein